MRRAGITIPAMKINKYVISIACICVVTLAIQHANRIFSAPYYIFFCDLSGCTMFFTSSNERQGGGYET
jgi:hypothetical protein